MSASNRLYFSNFRLAAIISITIALVILSLSEYIGKSRFFLLLNGDLGTAADYFFEYFTYLGDGLFWIAWLVWAIVKKQKPILPLLMSAFVIDAILTQFSKRVIFRNTPRPSAAITDGSFIHYVDGVIVHSINSFPSGHTVTAFTFMLLISLTMKSRHWTFLALTLAILVGYSRIYLGQHFPFDVGGGITVAVTSVYTATHVQRWFDKRSIKKVSA